MVCLRNICINTLHKGDNDGGDDDDEDNNNTENIKIFQFLATPTLTLAMVVQRVVHKVSS